MKSDQFRRIRREVLRMSQAELGEVMGVTKFTIINQEKRDIVMPRYALAIVTVARKTAAELNAEIQALQAAE